MDDQEFKDWHNTAADLIRKSMAVCRTEEERLEMVEVICRNAFASGGLATAKSIQKKLA